MSRAPIMSGTRKLAKPAMIGTTTRKIIVVPCIVMTWLYESFVRSFSLGVASCARMRMARTPAATNHMIDVAMYRIPIRLWSTVTSQPATRPLFQPTGYGASHLPATRLPLSLGVVDVLLHVGGERVELRFGPRVADRRHRPLRAGEAVTHDPDERLRLAEERVGEDRRPVAALPEVPVAGGAHAVPDLPADRLVPGREVVLVGPPGPCLHGRGHRGVEGTAELGALALIAARIRLEPGVVRPAGDRLDLAAECRDPPAVDHVRRDDLEVDDRAGGDVERPDRARAVRIVVLPVVLVAFDRDVDRVGRGRRGVDVRQLVEDEAGNDREDHDREDRPDQLETGVPVDLRPLDRARASAAPVLPDEDHEQRLDEQEDRCGEAEDEVVRVPDVNRVRRGRVYGCESAVPSCSNAGRREREQYGEDERRQLTAHARALYEGVRAYADRTAGACAARVRGLRRRHPPGAGA